MTDSRIKVPDRVVREIHEALSTMTQMEAAVKYGVSTKTVFLINKKKGRYSTILDGSAPTVSAEQGDNTCAE